MVEKLVVKFIHKRLIELVERIDKIIPVDLSLDSFSINVMIPNLNATNVINSLIYFIQQNMKEYFQTNSFYVPNELFSFGE